MNPISETENGSNAPAEKLANSHMVEIRAANAGWIHGSRGMNPSIAA